MKKSLLVSIISLLVLSGCGSSNNDSGSESVSSATAEVVIDPNFSTTVASDWTQSDKELMQSKLGVELQWLSLYNYQVREDNGYVFIYGQADFDETISGYQRLFLGLSSEGYTFARGGKNRFNGNDYRIKINDVVNVDLSYYNFGDDEYYVSAYCYKDDTVLKKYSDMTPGAVGEKYSVRFYSEDGTQEYVNKRLVVRYDSIIGEQLPYQNVDEFTGWYQKGEYKVDLNSPVTYNLALYSSYNRQESSENYFYTSSPDMTYSKVVSSANLTTYLNSTGDQKVLVIPVSFKGETHYDHEKGKKIIEEGFFGEASDTGWESLNSFYSTSSYGNLNITGEVSDWYESDYTSAEVQEMNTALNMSSITILRDAVEWYRTQNPDKIKEYDTDRDGYLDCVWLVYDHPYSTTDTSMWWAYVSRDGGNTGLFDIDRPLAYRYAWASLGFMLDGGYSKQDGTTAADMHTFIHEHGHLMGNEDYYDYTDSSETYTNTAWAGKTIMQDHNVGDHDMFSKLNFGWTSPKIVSGEGDIEIGLAETTGDCILVKNEYWNGSFMDEYILIEFYSPTMLNKLDAESAYRGRYPRLCTDYGLKVWHVDARVARTYAAGTTPISYTNTPENLSNYGLALAHSNTPHRSITTNRILLQLMEKGGASTFGKDSRYNPTNDLLFKQGDSFQPENFGDYFYYGGEFNDGTKIGYTFTVKSMDTEKAVITFTKR